MSYLSIKNIHYDYISLRDTRRDAMTIEYIHPLFVTQGLMTSLSDIKLIESVTALKLKLSTDKDILRIRKIETHLQKLLKDVDIIPILKDNYISFPFNPITSVLYSKKPSSGYITFKLLRYKYGRHKTIMHLNI
jgi:hypothetical protein